MPSFSSTVAFFKISAKSGPIKESGNARKTFSQKLTPFISHSQKLFSLPKAAATLN
jgi:hypothetical protein